jgi:hypothetical protein
MFVSLRLRWFSILKSEDSAAKMLHEDQGVRQCFVRTAVSETNPASLHELRWGNDVRIRARGLLDRTPEPGLVNRLPLRR